MWLKIFRPNGISLVNLSQCTDIYFTDDQITFHVGDARVAVLDEFENENQRLKIINQIDKFLTDNLPFTELNLHSGI